MSKTTFLFISWTKRYTLIVLCSKFSSFTKLISMLWHNSNEVFVAENDQASQNPENGFLKQAISVYPLF
ncbi:hypothetical protein AM592_02750 [Bacillus gobiensis]|uniref:Uncharacterized protein n=1 Tax=Bacillus gobiensis TaxID=1441095 RepID=A0A0M4G6S0_9BACI|nr:hypothetical protein AM592_02750 [Bacillus gobiensis]